MKDLLTVFIIQATDKNPQELVGISKNDPHTRLTFSNHAVISNLRDDHKYLDINGQRLLVGDRFVVLNENMAEGRVVHTNFPDIVVSYADGPYHKIVFGAQQNVRKIELFPLPVCGILSYSPPSPPGTPLISPLPIPPSPSPSPPIHQYQRPPPPQTQPLPPPLPLSPPKPHGKIFVWPLPFDRKRWPFRSQLVCRKGFANEVCQLSESTPNEKWNDFCAANGCGDSTERNTSPV